MAILGVEAQIADALFSYAADVAKKMGLPIAFQGVPFQPTNGQPYLFAEFIPNISDPVGMNAKSSTNRQGLLQISVFWPAGSGMVASMQVAAQISTIFGFTQRANRNGVSVMFEREGGVKPPIQETDWVHIPITISWRCLTA